MAERFTKYFQKCDFCHQEFEVPQTGLHSICLPGYYYDSDGCKSTQWIKADICDECVSRLREHLAKAVDIKEIAYGGTSIHWLDEKDDPNA